MSPFLKLHWNRSGCGHLEVILSAANEFWTDELSKYLTWTGTHAEDETVLVEEALPAFS